MGLKRICIVTNYSTTTNYGALLQAFALNKTISEMGYFPENLYVVGDNKSRNRKIFEQIKHFQLKKIEHEIVRYFKRLRVKKQLDERKKAMDQFRFSIPHTNKYNKSDLSNLQELYDIFICGSDQIFRPNKYTGKLEDHYWLSMINNTATKASYAASIGISSFEEDVKGEVVQNLSTFDFISIREATSAEYLKRITGRKDIVCSIDPVFLINREEWLSMSQPYNMEEPYILVYMIHGTKKLLQTIEEFSKYKDLKIVTFPSMASVYKEYESKFGDIKVVDASPLQFLQLINNASYIFTDSFHGTAISLILHKSVFISQANKIAFSRIDNIVNLLKVENLVIPPDGLSFENYLEERDINWHNVDSTIESQREKSLKYLRSVIDYCKSSN